MPGVIRSKNRSHHGYFWDVYYRTVIITFLITFGATLVIVLIQMKIGDTIEVSFAQDGTKLESSASVQFNPTNLLNEKLRQKEAVLTQKEVELQREESCFTEVIAINGTKILVYLFSISGALFLLILLNFFFDYQRRKSHVN